MPYPNDPPYIYKKVKKETIEITPGVSLANSAYSLIGVPSERETSATGKPEPRLLKPRKLTIDPSYARALNKMEECEVDRRNGFFEPLRLDNDVTLCVIGLEDVDSSGVLALSSENEMILAALIAQLPRAKYTKDRVYELALVHGRPVDVILLNSLLRVSEENEPPTYIILKREDGFGGKNGRVTHSEYCIEVGARTKDSPSGLEFTPTDVVYKKSYTPATREALERQLAAMRLYRKFNTNKFSPMFENVIGHAFLRPTRYPGFIRSLPANQRPRAVNKLSSLMTNAGKDLFEYLADYQGSLSLVQHILLALKVLEAVERVHALDYVHRDIKPENLGLGVELVDAEPSIDVTIDSTPSVSGSAFVATRASVDDDNDDAYDAMMMRDDDDSFDSYESADDEPNVCDVAPVTTVAAMTLNQEPAGFVDCLSDDEDQITPIRLKNEQPFVIVLDTEDAVKSGTVDNKLCGTPEFAAPETLYENNVNSKKIDVFSAGGTAAQVIGVQQVPPRPKKKPNVQQGPSSSTSSQIATEPPKRTDQWMFYYKIDAMKVAAKNFAKEVMGITEHGVRNLFNNASKEISKTHDFRGLKRLLTKMLRDHLCRDRKRLDDTLRQEFLAVASEVVDNTSKALRIIESANTILHSRKIEKLPPQKFIGDLGEQVDDDEPVVDVNRLITLLVNEVSNKLKLDNDAFGDQILITRMQLRQKCREINFSFHDRQDLIDEAKNVLSSRDIPPEFLDVEPRVKAATDFDELVDALINILTDKLIFDEEALLASMQNQYTYARYNFTNVYDLFEELAAQDLGLKSPEELSPHLKGELQSLADDTTKLFMAMTNQNPVQRPYISECVVRMRKVLAGATEIMELQKALKDAAAVDINQLEPDSVADDVVRPGL